MCPSTVCHAGIESMAQFKPNRSPRSSFRHRVVPGESLEASRLLTAAAPVPSRALRATWKSRHQLSLAFSQISGPVDLLSTPTRGTQAMLCNSHRPRWPKSAACLSFRTLSPTTAQGTRVVRYPGPSISHILHSRPGSIIQGHLFARCNSLLDNPVRHTAFILPFGPSGALPSTFYPSHIQLHHLSPGRSTTASQPASYSSRMHRPAEWGSGAPGRRFFSANGVLDHPLGGLFDNPPLPARPPSL
ncbi:hypothetical protein QBC39DRAFT_396298 [Podospora conica]|nr:hypothetical protein QBC39DRAFT_396298 [Schizothecium conicum]